MPAGYSTDLTQHYQVDTAAADGTANLDLAQPPSPSSYWVIRLLAYATLHIA
jgi:hypothetical protein